MLMYVYQEPKSGYFYSWVARRWGFGDGCLSVFANFSDTRSIPGLLPAYWF